MMRLEVPMRTNFYDETESELISLVLKVKRAAIFYRKFLWVENKKSNF